MIENSPAPVAMETVTTEDIEDADSMSAEDSTAQGIEE